jgi:NTE family protein
MSSAIALLNGAPNFFTLRHPPVWLNPNGALEATSFYDTKRLRSTLERLVDFDRINSGETRLSVGAVNVRNGNFVYFDTTTHIIGPDHVLASGSLPPGFPAVQIEGESYWDGGLISNTPLQWVVECGPPQDTLAFQVDLWSAAGELHATSPRSSRARRRSSFRAAPEPIPTSSNTCSGYEPRLRLCWTSFPRVCATAMR